MLLTPPPGQAMHQVTREEVQQAPQSEEDVVDDGAPEEHAAHLLDAHVRSPHDVEGSTAPPAYPGRGRGLMARAAAVAEPRLRVVFCPFATGRPIRTDILFHRHVGHLLGTPGHSRPSFKPSFDRHGRRMLNGSQLGRGGNGALPLRLLN
jgi:hypothetical protein